MKELSEEPEEIVTCLQYIEKLLLSKVEQPLTPIDLNRLSYTLTDLVKTYLKGSIFYGVYVGVMFSPENKLDISFNINGMPLDAYSQKAIWILLGNIELSDKTKLINYET